MATVVLTSTIAINPAQVAGFFYVNRCRLHRFPLCVSLRPRVRRKIAPAAPSACAQTLATHSARREGARLRRISGRTRGASCASDHAPSRARCARRLGPQPLIYRAGRPICLLSIAFTACLRHTSSASPLWGGCLGGSGTLRARLLELSPPLGRVRSGAPPPPQRRRSPSQFFLPRLAAIQKKPSLGGSWKAKVAGRKRRRSGALPPIRLPGAGAPSERWGAQRRTAPPTLALGGLGAAARRRVAPLPRPRYARKRAGRGSLRSRLAGARLALRGFALRARSCFAGRVCGAQISFFFPG